MDRSVGTPVKFTRAELDLASSRMALARATHERRIKNPIEWYDPSRPSPQRPWANQLGFHESTHAIRVLVPGNGWGKTTAMGAEVHWWATHTHPYQKTPPWPLLMLWFVRLSAQFELVREQLRTEIFGTTAVWKDQEYQWPDGSRLFLGSADKANDWTKWQGVPVDLCCFDEEPHWNIWKEMTLRRRAKRKTRYVAAATATRGESWMERRLYRPWLAHHQDLGLDETRALKVQAHPDIYCWTRGGIGDNPGADAADERWYEEMTKDMHPKERQVRLHGGFQNWVGDAVFDQMDWVEAQARAWDEKLGPGMLGMFEPEHAHGAHR